MQLHSITTLKYLFLKGKNCGTIFLKMLFGCPSGAISSESRTTHFNLCGIHPNIVPLSGSDCTTNSHLQFMCSVPFSVLIKLKLAA